MDKTFQTQDFVNVIKSGEAHQQKIREQLHTHVRKNGTSLVDIQMLTDTLLNDLAARSQQRDADHAEDKQSTIGFNTIRGTVLTLTAIATDSVVLARMPHNYASEVVSRLTANVDREHCYDGGSINFAAEKIVQKRNADYTKCIQFGVAEIVTGAKNDPENAQKFAYTLLCENARLTVKDTSNQLPIIQKALIALEDNDALPEVRQTMAVVRGMTMPKYG